MTKYRVWAVILLIVIVALGYFCYASEIRTTGFVSHFPFRLGLDLSGGTELTYQADTSKLASTEIDDAMSSLRDVIERRVNLFGVSEPVVQVEKAGGITGHSGNQLIVDLPGVTDISQAVALIGQTPLLEFDLQKEGVTPNASSTRADLFTPTGLTGSMLSSASLQFDSSTNAPMVSLQFNSEGSALFDKITKENTGKVLAIFLDGQILSAPQIKEEISGGQAQINGNFTPDQAKTLVRSLNYGALPVPIQLLGTESIGPSLGRDALFAGVKAGIIGLIILAIFLVVWYRLPGFIAVVALLMYIALSLTVFKMIPVTLTAAGLAGFILSIGMAVDANILIFERMKEEFKAGKSIDEGMHEGFHRAWLSIRDSNISSLITAAALFWLGTSSVKGFALTLGIGVLISMFTAITASRTFLYAITRKGAKSDGKFMRFLFSNGFHANIK